MNRLVSRLSRWHLALAAGLALAAVLIGVSLMGSQASATITLSAAPGGHISPEGIQHAAVGTDLTIDAWDDDPAMAAWLLVGAVGVQPILGSDGRYTYTLHVTGDTAVQASFVELAHNVRTLPVGFGTSIIAVSPTQDQVVLSGDSDFVTELAVGDIVVNQSGSGYDGRLMVRVIAIGHNNDQVVLTTEPVPFTAAIVRASIRALIPLTLQTDATGEPVSLLGPPVALAADPAATAGLSLDLAHTFSAGDKETGATATVEGHANLDLALTVNVDIAPRFGWPPGEVKLLEVALVESASASMSLDAEAHVHLVQAVELLSHDFPGTWISVFLVQPQLKLGVGADISGNASLKVSASTSEQLKVGLHYQDERWSAIDEFHTSTIGSASVDASAIARVFPTVRLGATIDFACTPYVEVQPGFMELSADIHANPWWKLDAGLSGTAGIDCDLLVTKLQYDLGDHEMARTPIRDARGPFIPTPSTASPLPSSSALQSAPSSVEATLPAPTDLPMPGVVTYEQLRSALVPAGLTCGIAVNDNNLFVCETIGRDGRRYAVQTGTSDTSRRLDGVHISVGDLPDGVCGFDNEDFLRTALAASAPGASPSDLDTWLTESLADARSRRGEESQYTEQIDGYWVNLDVEGCGEVRLDVARDESWEPDYSEYPFYAENLPPTGDPIWVSDFGVVLPDGTMQLLIEGASQAPYYRAVPIKNVVSVSELRFYIYVHDTGETILSSASNTNQATAEGKNTWTIAWEDGGGNAFGDVIIRVRLGGDGVPVRVFGGSAAPSPTSSP